MKLIFPWSNSLAQRIKWAYYFLIALIFLGLVISWFNLEQVRTRVLALKTTSELLDTILEIRRYEKNWILYGDTSDYIKNEEMIAKAFILLNEREREFVEIDPVATVDRLRGLLTAYSELIKRDAAQVNSVGQDQHMLEQIREDGKTMVSLAEILNNTVKSAITSTLKFITFSGGMFVILVAITALFLGKQLTISVVRPLRHIVDCTKRIAAGEVYSCESSLPANKLVEINTVLQAFDIMLKKLEHREKLIIQSEKLAAVGTLVAGVAHELNNPLSNAGTSAQILLEEMSESREVPWKFQIEMLQQITEQTDRARSIVKSLLEFSREKEVNPERLKISELLHQTMDLVRGEIPTHVKMSVKVTRDGLFWADKQRLQQGLVNLLLNAFQAMGDMDNPGDSFIILRGGLDEDGTLVRFEVEDNGPGIPAAILENIFDPFFTTKDVGEGSGLGLAVTREIVEKHGGAITVDTVEGHGAKFIITLPAELPASSESVNEQP